MNILKLQKDIISAANARDNGRSSYPFFAYRDGDTTYISEGHWIIKTTQPIYIDFAKTGFRDDMESLKALMEEAENNLCDVDLTARGFIGDRPVDMYREYGDQNRPWSGQYHVINDHFLDYFKKSDRFKIYVAITGKTKRACEPLLFKAATGETMYILPVNADDTTAAKIERERMTGAA